jgi:GTP-binding protein HflX
MIDLLRDSDRLIRQTAARGLAAAKVGESLPALAAFRATLEEVLEANIILHIRDSAHPDSEAQKADVEEVLRGLFKTEAMPENVIEVYNKIDRLDPEHLAALRDKGMIAISAITGEGIDHLLATIDKEIENRMYTRAQYSLDLNDGKLLAWLHAHGKVVEQVVEGDYIHVTAFLSEDNIRRFESMQHVGSH